MHADRSQRRFTGTTFTGVDECTSMDDMRVLADQPNVELAFLYSLDREGPRFVSEQWMRSTLTELTRHSRRLALHVCGQTARRKLLNGELAALTRLFSRVQVNGEIGVSELSCLHDSVPHLITQHLPANYALAHSQLVRHSILVDGSGGTGHLPSFWAIPMTSHAVGFAGGLRLSNLQEEYQRIAAVADDGWWIDMESGLRTSNDRFDPQAAWDILALVEKLRSTHESQQA